MANICVICHFATAQCDWEA